MKFLLGGKLHCDLQKLIVTRALVQANSGGGKSWALRRLLEQTHGHVQQIILDPEGEFSSLREKFDYVLAAKQGGDTVADPRSAKLLAERLLELRVSAICDIYELTPPARIAFVKAFLEAMINAPKTLWHPVLVVVDEAHTFCPQKGEAESAAAVIDLTARGRKRGFCAIIATQRLSKLHKDAAAELNNKLIGRCSLDVDRARASEELGFSTKEQSLSLRRLDPGHWYAFGPAVSADVVEVQIGPVQTTHPEAGDRIAFEPPPATAKIKALLPKLADLPAEAEQRHKTEIELKRDLQQARSRITQLEHQTPARTVEKVKTVGEKVEVPVLKESQIGALDRIVGRLEQFSLGQTDVVKGVREIAAGIRQAMAPRPGIGGSVPPRVVTEPQRTRTEAITPRPVQTSAKPAVLRSDAIGAPVPKGERAVLRAVAHYPEGCSRKQLTVLTGYKKSSRDTYLQRLRERGLVDLRGDRAIATAEGLQELGPDFEPLPIGAALLEHWRRRLPEGERKILDVLVEAYPKPVERAAIDEATGYRKSSRDTYLQRLAAKRLIELEGRGRGAVQASELLFDDPFLRDDR